MGDQHLHSYSGPLTSSPAYFAFFALLLVFFFFKSRMQLLSSTQTQRGDGRVLILSWFSSHVTFALYEERDSESIPPKSSHWGLAIVSLTCLPLLAQTDSVTRALTSVWHARKLHSHRACRPDTSTGQMNTVSCDRSVVCCSSGEPPRSQELGVALMNASPDSCCL